MKFFNILQKNFIPIKEFCAIITKKNLRILYFKGFWYCFDELLKYYRRLLSNKTNISFENSLYYNIPQILCRYFFTRKDPKENHNIIIKYLSP